MDLVYNCSDYSDEEFDMPQKPIRLNQTNKKSFLRYFFEEFQGRELIKNGINLGFMYLMTQYVMSESSNIFVFCALGIAFLNAQTALQKYAVNKFI
jgi:hypothetical protein